MPFSFFGPLFTAPHASRQQGRQTADHRLLAKILFNFFGHVFFKWSFLLICNFLKSGDLNEEKVIDALIVLVFESTKVTQKGLICYISKERSSYLQYFVTYGHLN